MDYKKLYEKAVKARTNRLHLGAGTNAFQAPSAKEQLESAKQGLMRRAESVPQDDPDQDGLATGIFMALGEAMEYGKGEELEGSSPRPPGPSPFIDPIPGKEDVGSFRDKLKMSESSGDTDVQITIEDGRKMTGVYQFSDARLKDYRKATGENFSREDFRNDPELQEKVADWHFNQIDQTISKLGAVSEGWDQDGLRAVAHLGGVSGMKKFVETNGKYNPSDDFNTSLMDYYIKFKG
jgi:hypothetical protein